MTHTSATLSRTTGTLPAGAHSPEMASTVGFFALAFRPGVYPMVRWLFGILTFGVVLAVAALAGVVETRRLYELLFFDALAVVSAGVLAHVARGAA
jgi:hypothetical protein